MKASVNFESFTPSVRYAEDLKPVLYQPEMLKENFPAYYMYRDSCLEEHRKVILAKGLRYDYTVTPPSKIGTEFVKTFGHYHPKANSLSYPELYQVIEGEALFLIQRRGSDEREIEDFIVIEAGEGDIVLIPPEYGHVLVNASKKKLVTSNWVSRNFQSIYTQYKRLRGACYYYTESGWVKNERYSRIPEIRFAKSLANEIFDVDGDMYWLIEIPEKLEFLNKPEKHRALFEKILEFQ